MIISNKKADTLFIHTLHTSLVN